MASSKWKSNAPIIILIIYSAMLLSLQISNTQYHCFSENLVECDKFQSPHDAKCTGPGTFTGLLKDSSTQVSVYCPWLLWESLKVLILLILVLVIGNWYLLQLILNIDWYILPFAVLLGILAPLTLASGILDLVKVATTECSSVAIQTFVNDHCSQSWFYINAILEIVQSVVIVAASYSVLKWRKLHEFSHPKETKYNLLKNKPEDL